jgi:hypothetical protein
MEKFGIEPVFPQTLSEIARFLLKCRAPDVPSQSASEIAAKDVADVEHRVRWLLLDNPAAKHAEPLGFSARDGDGNIRGLTLCFPAFFRQEEKRIAGLGSGSFFVDPAMRSAGFFLFKKYIARSGYSFYFATTCNLASAPLWQQLGGTAVPGSEIELVVPLKLDTVVANRVARRFPGTVATEIARLGGRCATPLFGLLSRSNAQIKVESCGDWEKLAALSRQHSRPDRLTSERSAEMLSWRYGPNSPMPSGDAYLIQDAQGNEGWFALSGVATRTADKVIGCTLLDAIWPSEKIRFRDILPQIIRMAPVRADAISIRCKADFDFTSAWRWFHRRRLASPRTYIIVAKGMPSVDVELFDYDDNDYVAWS